MSVVADAAYIHIPFCARVCPYCDFTVAQYSLKAADNYLEALSEEAAKLQSSCNSRNPLSVKTLYIGGGTPSILSSLQLQKMFEILGRTFNLADVEEFSVEANPGGLSERKLAVLKDGGVNRISLGVQSLNDKTLKQLGRLHTAQQALSAYERITSAGFVNRNIDIIFGVPNQTFDDFAKDLDAVIDAAPEHISLYSLTYEEGTHFTRMRDAGNIIQCDEGLELEMYKYAIKRLKKANWRHIEISNFARDGFECAHNLVYWNNRPYYALGAGACSFALKVRSVNVRDVNEYIKMAKNNSAICEQETLSEKEFAKETAMMMLRLRSGIDEKEFFNYTKIPLSDIIDIEYKQMIDGGLIERKGNYFRLTKKGLYVANSVIGQLLYS